MTPAVNLLWCVPGDVGGSEQYLVRQMAGLAEVGVRTRIFAPAGFASSHGSLAGSHEIVSASHDCRSRGRRTFTESTWLRRRSRGSSLVHHGGGTVPWRSARPVVLTIHDLQYREFPSYFSPRKLAYLRAIMPRSARRADLIAVPTDFVARTVVDAYGVDRDRVRVVPHGVENDLAERCTTESELRGRLGLGDAPVMVMPAATYPHKGHLFLLDVVERCWSTQGVRVVLIGGAGLADADVRRRLGDSRLAGAVVHAGRVSDEDRNGLVRMARAMVLPSEYEGFGAPVIEAMALGTPVVTSDRACLPEVVGDAGLVLPLDVDSWSVVPDLVEARRDELIRRGTERVGDFSIAASGRALAATYSEVAR